MVNDMGALADRLRSARSLLDAAHALSALEWAATHDGEVLPDDMRANLDDLDDTWQRLPDSDRLTVRNRFRDAMDHGVQILGLEGVSPDPFDSADVTIQDLSWLGWRGCPPNPYADASPQRFVMDGAAMWWAVVAASSEETPPLHPLGPVIRAWLDWGHPMDPDTRDTRILPTSLFDWADHKAPAILELSLNDNRIPDRPGRLEPDVELLIPGLEGPESAVIPPSTLVMTDAAGFAGSVPGRGSRIDKRLMVEAILAIRRAAIGKGGGRFTWMPDLREIVHEIVWPAPAVTGTGKGTRSLWKPHKHAAILARAMNAVSIARVISTRPDAMGPCHVPASARFCKSEIARTNRNIPASRVRSRCRHPARQPDSGRHGVRSGIRRRTRARRNMGPRQGEKRGIPDLRHAAASPPEHRRCPDPRGRHTDTRTFGQPDPTPDRPAVARRHGTSTRLATP